MTQDNPQPEAQEPRRPLLERLGKYRIIEELGRGGMAVVFKAEDSESGGFVAVKALLPELVAQPAFVKRFRREIETHRGLEHPSVVQIIDVGQEGQVQYYVMEYMDGPTLEKRLRLAGKMSVPEALEVARSVTSALHYAHSRGVIHRDIKPANIMTNSAGEVKLADFGIAKDADATRLTVTGGIVGTADYMSPEQAEGKRVTRKSDIYSVGVCLYQMLTGRLPFVGKTYLDVIRAHRFSIAESPRTLNPSIPARIARLIECMMEKDPDKRPSSAAEVLAQLEFLDRSHGELTDEERESAKAMVKDALFPAATWKEVTFRVVVGVALAVIFVLVIKGMHYRYFTTAAHKYSLGMAAFEEGKDRLAQDYFEETAYFHPGTNEAKLADERITEIRHIRELQEEPIQPVEKAQPSAMHLYEKAIGYLESGNRDRGVKLLRRLSDDLPDTDGGKLAAAKLAELSGLAPGMQPTRLVPIQIPTPDSSAPQG